VAGASEGKTAVSAAPYE
jgi:hypothetical protein